jgi:prepilin-type N-terminal cleavage/methylation domain-containing protein
MRRRHGFTIIELLIVVTIIAVLAGMVLATINYLRESTKRATTQAILNAASAGLSMMATKNNISLAAIEHPLANTRDYPGALTRSVFVRGQSGTGYSQGDVVAQSGTPFTIADPTTIDPTSLTHVLMPTDRYAGLSATDTDDPTIFGLQRSYLTIVGTGWGLHSLRRLPELSPAHDRAPSDGLLDLPYDDAHYPGSMDNAGGDIYADTRTLEIAQKKAIDLAFGPEVFSELVALHGIITADDSGCEGGGTAIICTQRLRSLTGYGSFTSYSPSSIPSRSAPMAKDVDGKWWAYRLRGPVLYDAWKREILCYQSSNGSMVFESAGRDGFFRWDPGPDGVFQTAAGDDTPSGDDKDATKDNQLTGQR